MKIKLVYKSKSGFTKQYAEWIVQETGCELIPEKAANISAVKGCDVLVYGSRMHAGRVDGLSKVRKLFVGSGAKHFIVFAAGGLLGDVLAHTVCAVCDAKNRKENMIRGLLKIGQRIYDTLMIDRKGQRGGICREREIFSTSGGKAAAHHQRRIPCVF